jgi:predicted transcriptional regulator|tara:strand:+ start:3801 stop:4001 length:201 start_codon:yes stop_codon:yes gene_type:complete
MRYLKVEGHENLYRDTNTGAIINTDKPAPRNFSQTFNGALQDINSLKEEISEIKQLLREIVNNVSS